MKKLAIAAAAFVGLAGCSAGENLSAAEREVERFHRLAAQGQGQRLYDGAAEDFKRMADEREFRDLLQVIDERLGDVVAADRQGWHVNYTPGGAVVTLTYATRFERGRGTERFVYRIEEERPLLIGYFVNSSAMAPRPAGSGGEGVARQIRDPEGGTNGSDFVVTAPAEGE